MPRSPAAGPRHQLDIAIHQLWRQHPEPLLRLATGFPTARLKQTLPERISSVRREADGVALAEGPHGPFLAHIEFHSDTSPRRVARQMYLTGALLYARHGGRYPVLGTAVLLDRRSAMHGEFHLDYGSERLVDMRFRVVRIYDIPAAELARDAGLAPLCPLGRAARPEDLSLAQRVIEQGGGGDDDTREAVAILYILAGRRFDAAVLDRLLWRTDVMQSSTFMKIYNMGMTQGEQRGEQRGVHQGMVLGERRILCRLLERRFGALPEWAAALIASADGPQIEAWTDHLEEASTLEGLLAGREPG